MTNEEKAREISNKSHSDVLQAGSYFGAMEMAEWKDKNTWRNASEELPELEKDVICLYEAEDKSSYVCFNHRTVDDRVDTIENEWVNLSGIFDRKEPSYWLYEPPRKREKITMIHEERIKELNDMLEACIEKRNVLSNEIVEIKKKMTSTFEEEAPIRRELDNLIVEQWIDRGKKGYNKALKNNEVPTVVKNVREHIMNRISDFCGVYGDDDGCYGCAKRCYEKADEEWRRMFGFDPDINHR